jgi:Ca2+-binding RTX toxin-like protein
VVDTATGLNGQLTDTKTFTNDVAVKVDAIAPVINTSHFQVLHDGDSNTDTITGLSVVDADSGAATDGFTITAVTAHDTASSVVPGSASGHLDDINATLANGVTYDPIGASTDPETAPPATDQITVTVTDTTTGLYDTVNFIFNEAGDTSQGITLQGTSGKDVIFATETGDTLIGGAGKDQFVFSPGSSGGDAQHTIKDFETGLDKIDLRQFSDVSSINDLHFTSSTHGLLVTWSQQIGTGAEGAPATENEAILLKNVIAANLKSSDFIFHA